MFDAELVVERTIEYLNRRGYIDRDDMDELEWEKLAEDCKIALGLIRYEVIKKGD